MIELRKGPRLKRGKALQKSRSDAVGLSSQLADHQESFSSQQNRKGRQPKRGKTNHNNQTDMVVISSQLSNDQEVSAFQQNPKNSQRKRGKAIQDNRPDIVVTSSQLPDDQELPSSYQRNPKDSQRKRGRAIEDNRSDTVVTSSQLPDDQEISASYQQNPDGLKCKRGKTNQNNRSDTVVISSQLPDDQEVTASQLPDDQELPASYQQNPKGSRRKRGKAIQNNRSETVVISSQLPDDQDILTSHQEIPNDLQHKRGKTNQNSQLDTVVISSQLPHEFTASQLPDDLPASYQQHLKDSQGRGKKIQNNRADTVVISSQLPNGQEISASYQQIPNGLQHERGKTDQNNQFDTVIISSQLPDDIFTTDMISPQLPNAQHKSGKTVQSNQSDAVDKFSQLPDPKVVFGSQQNPEDVHVAGGDALAMTLPSVAASQAAESVSVRASKRGPYRGYSLVKDCMRQGEKVKIEFTADGGRPLTATQSARMASEVGKACRDLLPLYIDGDWRTLPIEVKHRAWERVQNRLNLDDIMTNPIKFRAADRWMSQLHKKHRADVKKKWKEVGDLARPAGSNDDDWRNITDKWEQELDEEREILSSEQPTEKRTKVMKARDARKAVKYLHRGGSKSFHSRRNEYIQKFNKVPDDILFFKQTRYSDLKPDGSGGWVSQDAAKAYEKMVEMRLESLSSDTPISSSDIVDKIMGAGSRSDYHPGQGYGSPSIGKSSRKSSRRRTMESEFEQKLIDTRAAYESEIVALKQINIEQQDHIDELVRTVEKLIKNIPSTSREVSRRKVCAPSLGSMHIGEDETNSEID